MNKKVGWYVYATLKGKSACVSGCFETRSGADVYRRMYEANYPDSKPYIEQHAKTQEPQT